MSPTKPRKLTPRQEASSADTAPERLTELAQDPKLARLVAANPNASADLLLELSHSDDKAVRKACTSNANTPVEALLKLGGQFPEQLLENPVFDLLLLAHPGLFEDLPTATLNSLLKRDQVPVGLIRWAWKHRGESTLQSLLMNPNTPADVVEELCQSKDLEVRMAAELHCSRELPRWGCMINDSLDLDVAHELLHDQLVFGDTQKWNEIIDTLVDHGDPQLRRRLTPLMPVSRKAELAGNCSTSVEFLLVFARDTDACIRRSVAKNSRTPAKALAMLAIDPDALIRMGLAGNFETPTKVLVQLAQDPNAGVRWNVAGNSKTPEELLSLLAMDKDEEVRRVVATNSQTPIEALTHLSKDPRKTVRLAVARNNRTPTEVPVLLAEDSDKDVLREVVRHSVTTKPLAASLRETLLVRTCEKGCKGSQPSPGRRFLLTLPQCPANLLAKNFRSRSWLERFAIAGNPSTPEAVLERMANEGNQLVRRAARSNLAQRATDAEKPFAQPNNP